jgi:hypothetical protein
MNRQFNSKNQNPDKIAIWLKNIFLLRLVNPRLPTPDPGNGGQVRAYEPSWLLQNWFNATKTPRLEVSQRIPKKYC